MPIDLLLRKNNGADKLTKDELDQNFIDIQAAVNSSHNEVVNVSVNTTLSDIRIALVDASAAGLTVILPNVSTVTNQEFIIKKIDSSPNVVTIATYNTDVIEGTTELTINTQWTVIRVVSNGTAWYVV